MKVYTVGGVEVEADIQRNGDTVAVNLNGLAAGVYVVSTGKSSLKVMKK